MSLNLQEPPASHAAMSFTQNNNLPKVLFVDDDPIVTRFVENTFGKLHENFSPVIAHDGLQAIEILKKEPIQAVITDMQMPKMDGSELLSYIFDNHPEIPCGILTSTPADSQMENGQIKTFIKKPVEAVTIYAAVEKMLHSDAKLTGEIKGLSLANVLQLAESEKKNCTMEVIVPDNPSGFFYVKYGRLLDAIYGDLAGVEAAQALLIAPVENIIMGPLPTLEPREVLHTSVMNLLLDILQKTDENSRDSQDTEGDLDAEKIRNTLESFSGVRDGQVKMLIKPLIQLKTVPFFYGMLISDSFNNLWYSKSDVPFLNKTNMHKFLRALSLEGNQIENADIGETHEVLWSTDKVILIYQQSPVLGNVQLKIMTAIAPGPHQNMFRAKLKHTVNHMLPIVAQTEAYQKISLETLAKK